MRALPHNLPLCCHGVVLCCAVLRPLWCAFLCSGVRQRQLTYDIKEKHKLDVYKVRSLTEAEARGSAPHTHTPICPSSCCDCAATVSPLFSMLQALRRVDPEAFRQLFTRKEVLVSDGCGWLCNRTYVAGCLLGEIVAAVMTDAPLPLNAIRTQLFHRSPSSSAPRYTHNTTPPPHPPPHRSMTRSRCPGPLLCWTPCSPAPSHGPSWACLSGHPLPGSPSAPCWHSHGCCCSCGLCLRLSGLVWP